MTGVCVGFRISELLSLKVEDIRGALSDAPEAQIHVRRRSMKGKRKGRSVWAHSDARTALRMYMLSRPDAKDGEFVFAASSPKLASNKHSPAIGRQWAWRLLRKAFRRAGIYDNTVATHSMRKTFAQEIYEASGRNLHVTQKALDHANIQSTVKYLHSVDVDVKAFILNRKIA